MKPLYRLLRYLRGQVGTLVVAYACMVIYNLTTVIYAALIGPALEFVFSGDIDDVMRTSEGELRSIWGWVPADWIAYVDGLDATGALFVLPAIIVFTALLKGFGQTGQFFLFGRISQRALRRLRAESFDAMLRQSPAFFGKRAHGDLLSRLTHDAGQVEQAFFYGFGSLLRDTLAVVGLLAFVFWSDPKLALLTFITVPIAVVPLARFSKWLKKVSKRGQAAQGDINAVAYEALAGVRVVQAFGNEARENERLEVAAERYYGQMLVSYFIRAVRTPTMEVLGAVAAAALIGLLGYYVQNQTVDAAHYVSFLGAIFLMYDPLKRLGRVTDYLAAGSAAAERIFEVVDLEPAIQDRPGAAALPAFEGSVRFEDVTFAYEEGQPVLQSIDLELATGQVVALVGSSGGGKTTMANLLPRFYDVTGGAITIDGRDIRDVTLSSLRAQIGVVSQETFLFNASVGQNIAYGATNADQPAVERAAKLAYADEFIAQLDGGYATVIGERGVRLSGGQRQRLAIARALLRDAPLLILDEATSALDVESERYVQRALEQLMKGRTSLVIAHRLTTIRRADLICVLKAGRIVERGRHDDLLAAGGEYARLYELQFSDEDAGAPPTTGSAETTA